MRHQDKKFPDSKTRLNFLRKNYVLATPEYNAAIDSIQFMLTEIQGYTLKIYEQRDQALKLLDEGNIEEAKFWLNKIGAVE